MYLFIVLFIYFNFFYLFYLFFFCCHSPFSIINVETSVQQILINSLKLFTCKMQFTTALCKFFSLALDSSVGSMFDFILAMNTGDVSKSIAY